MASILKVDTIQDQSGNNIINESANVITIGASGDTITIPSGATLANSGIVTGFQSTGIDDNATSTALTINSANDATFSGIVTADEFNFSTSGDLHAGSTASSVSIAGGTNSNVGANIILYGSTHPSEANVARFRVNASETMRITSIGNVGIGKSSVSGVKMDVLATLTDNLVARFENNHATGSYGISVKAGDDSGNYSADFADKSGTSLMRIRGDGNIGIGTTSPVGQLTLNKSSDLNFLQGGYGISWGTSSGASPRIIGSNADAIRFFHGGGSEAMRIISAGNLCIGKTSNSFSTAGSDFPPNGKGVFVVNADECIILNRLTNDGSLIRFYQDGTEEGSISVSGATVAYNGFTGTHWSRFTDNSTPNILRGTVLESLDEMCDWYNLHFETTDEEGNTSTQKIPHVLQEGQSNGDVITYNHEGTDVQATIVKETDVKHVKSKVSDTVDAKNVYGVFSAYDEDGEGYNDFYVASVGSFVVRIKQGETIAKGDLLQSNGDGTAKVQTDDNIKSSSFAKVLSTTIIETYEDGSYLVPCSLMC